MQAEWGFSKELTNRLLIIVQGELTTVATKLH